MGNIVPFKATDKIGVRISVSKGRRDRVNNKTVAWQTLCERLSEFKVDTRTMSQFASLTKDAQSKAKNVGYFVAAHFRNGVRHRNRMEQRSILTLDIDQCTPAQLAVLRAGEGEIGGYEYVIHSTRSHTPDAPRIRMVVLLGGPLDHDKFQPLSRIVAQMIDPEMLMVDPVSWNEAQVMFWPSRCVDGDEVYYRNPGAVLDADSLLDAYGPWQDYGKLPRSARETEIRARADKAADPLTKRGVVGAFCRTYSVHQAIATFLPDTYTGSEMGGDGEWARYSYARGSGVNGVVVYDAGTALTSHHGTDPVGAYGSVNAFDLRRIHEFGHLDDKAREGTTAGEMPSYKAMVEALGDDADVQQELLAGRYQDDSDDAWDDMPATEEEEEAAETPDPLLDAPAAPAGDWRKGLDRNEEGTVKSNLPNIMMILRHDPAFAGRFAYDEFYDMPVVLKPISSKRLGARAVGRCEADPAGRQRVEHLSLCRAILESHDKTGSRGWRLRVSDRDLKEAHRLVSDMTRVHPVRDYLDALGWDGTPRLGQLWVKTCHTADDAYHQEAARLFCIGAVARVYEPGCKFDFAPIIMGPQGLLKSTLVHVLGVHWSGEMEGHFDDQQRFVESTRGYWLIEIPELVSFSRIEVNAVKACLSRREDVVRLPYEPMPKVFPRKGVMIGTTNEPTYLKDKTGNRRFWPINCGPGQIDIAWLRRNLDQLWAEAVAGYRAMRAEQAGVTLPLYLQGDAAEIALRMQSEAMVEDAADDLAGKIEAWLDEPVPASQAVFGADPGDPGDDLMDEPTALRRTTCAREIWEKCLGGAEGDYDQRKAQSMIAPAMKRVNGWVSQRGRRTKRYGKQRVYVRTGGSDL